jgi:light-regulated signal transduction histidine kinase (bacteriophytochrome)
MISNSELKKAEYQIAQLNAQLEQRIVERTVQLETANKELESFSYSVSHDLRAPLRAINGFTQVLVEDYSASLDAEGKDILDDIIRNSQRMGELIDNLLEFSRIGKQNISVATVSIKDMVDSVIADLKHAEPHRNIRVIVNKLENIKADRNMLKQVFINLISNAFKYSGKKAEALVEIGSFQANDYCTYYVKDNGAGFDMLYYDKLFGVFQRLHSNNEFEGTGVGLAIIHKIITKHGGSVWAEAKVNEGACFYFSLPDSLKATN